MVSDEEDEEDNDLDFGNFSTCSPRFTRLLSIADNKDYQSQLKDLEEQASKEASSADEMPDDRSDITDENSSTTDNLTSLDSKEDFDDANDQHHEATTVVGDSDGEQQTKIKGDSVRQKLEDLLLRPDDIVGTDSGFDSGSHTGNNSLDGSMNSMTSCLLKKVQQTEMIRKGEDSDRDTE